MPVRPCLSCPAGSGNRRRRSWTRIRKICVIGNFINPREKRPVALRKAESLRNLVAMRSDSATFLHNAEVALIFEDPGCLFVGRKKRLPMEQAGSSSPRESLSTGIAGI